MIEFASDFRIALAVNFVASECIHLRTQFAPIDDGLLIFNLDINLARANFRPHRLGVPERFR